jgi:hypothetical protein
MARLLPGAAISLPPPEATVSHRADAALVILLTPGKPVTRWQAFARPALAVHRGARERVCYTPGMEPPSGLVPAVPGAPILRPGHPGQAPASPGRAGMRR